MPSLLDGLTLTWRCALDAHAEEPDIPRVMWSSSPKNAVGEESVELPQIYKDRQQFSQMRVDELRNRLGEDKHAQALPDLTIFAAGSYGRLEGPQI
jgi:hypothetical protein